MTQTSAAPRPRILVVDDEPPMCTLLERVLSEAGYDAVSATSGPDAIELMKTRGPFALVVADVMMPGMTGDELVMQLRRAEPDLKILYLTGYVDRLFEKKEHLWEDEAFLEKPTKPEGVLEAVSLLLSGRISPAA
ncbi:MAG TPA: response regulator [Vicinamibacterales bacterium]|nr:response regulator [Vicinamibacterales bacterium]